MSETDGTIGKRGPLGKIKREYGAEDKHRGKDVVFISSRQMQGTSAKAVLQHIIKSPGPSLAE